jgi:hypothetical protein
MVAGWFNPLLCVSLRERPAARETCIRGMFCGEMSAAGKRCVMRRYSSKATFLAAIAAARNDHQRGCASKSMPTPMLRLEKDPYWGELLLRW